MPDNSVFTFEAHSVYVEIRLLYHCLLKIARSLEKIDTHGETLIIQLGRSLKEERSPNSCTLRMKHQVIVRGLRAANLKEHTMCKAAMKYLQI